MFKEKSNSLDPSFNKISLANWFLKRSITCVGALINNRKGIPVELRGNKVREKFSKTLHFEKNEKDINLCTYTVKTKSSGKENVIRFWTMRPFAGITKDKKKPEIFYIQVVNQINDHYTMGIELRQWDVLNFYIY